MHPSAATSHASRFAKLDGYDYYAQHTQHIHKIRRGNTSSSKKKLLIVFGNATQREAPTNQRLKLANQDRRQVLFCKLEQEFEANTSQLLGTDKNLLQARIQILIDNILLLNPLNFTMGLTNDQSLYGRVHLSDSKGTIHLELLLGEEFSCDENTFATLYNNHEQKWSLSGEFKEVLLNLRRSLGLLS